jgi:hypothetical protein
MPEQPAPSFRANPFQVEGVALNMPHAKRMDFVSRRDGEMLELETIPKTKLHDPQTYIKLFVGKLPLLQSLSLPGLRLLLYIAGELRPNRDYIYLHYTEASETFAGTRSSFYRSIRELTEKKVLAPSFRKHEHWINPNVLYNGDRVQLFKKQSREKG